MRKIHRAPEILGSFLAMILFIFSASAVSYAQYDPKAYAVLEGMSKYYKKYPSFSSSISSTLLNEAEGIREEFKGEIIVKGNKFKLILRDQEVINNGKTTWTYLPSANEVTVDNVDPNAEETNPARIYDLYKKGYKYLYIGEKNENGVLCDEVDLVPEKRDAQFFKIKLLVNKKTKAIKNWVMYERNGNRYHYVILSFIPDAKITDALFTFDAKKYPGVEVVDLR